MKRLFFIFHFSFFIPLAAHAVSFPTQNNPQPFSQYGQIQNVQNYSSNPFWTPNSPYNQRMPQPVYAQGADLNAADCQTLTARLVVQECAYKNNCVGVKFNDVRPALIVQLSKMQGHNYVGSCSGYLEPAFNDYVARYGTTVSGTAFPTATIPGSNRDGSQFQIENPYPDTYPQFYGDEWYQGMVDRQDEMNALQTRTAANDTLARATFPTTYADVSFTERMENARTGYQPWRGESAYKTIQIETDLQRYTREAEEAQQRNIKCMMTNPMTQYLEQDLATLHACKQRGKKLSDCRLAGSY